MSLIQGCVQREDGEWIGSKMERGRSGGEEQVSRRRLRV